MRNIQSRFCKNKLFFSNAMDTERARVRGMIRRVFLFYLKLVSSGCILFLVELQQVCSQSPVVKGTLDFAINYIFMISSLEQSRAMTLRTFA